MRSVVLPVGFILGCELRQRSSGAFPSSLLCISEKMAHPPTLHLWTSSEFGLLGPSGQARWTIGLDTVLPSLCMLNCVVGVLVQISAVWESGLIKNEPGGGGWTSSTCGKSQPSPCRQVGSFKPVFARASPVGATSPSRSQLCTGTLAEAGLFEWECVGMSDTGESPCRQS